MYCDLWLQYIKVRKLFKGGKYSRAETIRGNTVIFFKKNKRHLFYPGRGDIETLLASPKCSDWISITEMFLGKVPEGHRFEPKHKAHGYRTG